jgi:hypothetical protein
VGLKVGIRVTKKPLPRNRILAGIIANVNVKLSLSKKDCRNVQLIRLYVSITVLIAGKMSFSLGL